MPSRRRILAVGSVVLASLLAVGVAYAMPSIGPHDVETVFFVAKSDDRNRVDYGVHLDASCAPVGQSPMFAYWRRFEPGQERLGDLNFLDQTAYGLAQQEVGASDGAGVWIRIRLRALASRPVQVRVQRGPTGCVGAALLDIRGRDAILDHVFVQLGGPGSIDHVMIRGQERLSGQPVYERVTR